MSLALSSLATMGFQAAPIVSRAPAATAVSMSAITPGAHRRTAPRALAAAGLAAPPLAGSGMLTVRRSHLLQATSAPRARLACTTRSAS